MTISGGRQGRRRGGGSAVFRRLAPWGIVREKVSGILVGNKRMKKEGQKRPVLASVGSTADNFPYPSFRSMEDSNLEEVPFPKFQAV